MPHSRRNAVRGPPGAHSAPSTAHSRPDALHGVRQHVGCAPGHSRQRSRPRRRHARQQRPGHVRATAPPSASASARFTMSGGRDTRLASLRNASGGRSATAPNKGRTGSTATDPGRFPGVLPPFRGSRSCVTDDPTASIPAPIPSKPPDPLAVAAPRSVLRPSNKRSPSGRPTRVGAGVEIRRPAPGPTPTRSHPHRRYRPCTPSPPEPPV